MPNQVLSSVENNFTKGLVTEFTGLNFPENAATDTNNCTYTLVGDVTRRQGIDNEVNATFSPGIGGNNNGSLAHNAYKWNNCGGDSTTEIVVRQLGATIFFYESSASIATAPLSNQLLASTVNLAPFVAPGTLFLDTSLECQFTDGNGYLFIFHPNCDPIYCTFNSGVISAFAIPVQIRDFTGVPDLMQVNSRPAFFNNEHMYNLQNQGWTQGAPWSATTGGGVFATPGVQSMQVAAGLAVGIGNVVQMTLLVNNFPGGNLVPAGYLFATGTVTGYVGTTLTVNITTVNSTFNGGSEAGGLLIIPTSIGYINTWLSATSTYPSNADQWWTFKNTSGVFSPSTTLGNVTLGSGPAPKGHYILSAFNQQRGNVSGLNVNDIATTQRPHTGCWFQGRVWYAGTNAQQPPTGDEPYYSWSENIYFSQIVQSTADFGNCYQTNDPTSETLFDLLPSDGGVITIQGCGTIYKLFPLMNALLVFAANGVWYLSGSTGIGFTANDYSIVKLSAVKSISSTSFVDVNGLPIFWNEEGIYQVEPAKQGQSLLNSPLHVNPLEVSPITVGTILSFYNNIPVQSKRYVKGAYHPIDYVVQWTYRSTPEAGISNRYVFDTILNYNTYNKAFYPYTVDTSVSSINGIVYVSSPSSFAPQPTFKYLSSNIALTQFTFADEHGSSYTDWASVTVGGVNYTSYFVAGYRLHGQGQRRFQIPYIYMFSRNDAPNGYKIQGLWDYAISGNSGRWSVAQLVNNFNPNFGMIIRRHKIRGQGLVLQLKVSSQDGKPFDLMGWSSFETQNTGV